MSSEDAEHRPYGIPTAFPVRPSLAPLLVPLVGSAVLVWNIDRAIAGPKPDRDIFWYIAAATILFLSLLHAIQIWILNGRLERLEARAGFVRGTTGEVRFEKE